MNVLSLSARYSSHVFTKSPSSRRKALTVRPSSPNPPSTSISQSSIMSVGAICLCPSFHSCKELIPKIRKRISIRIRAACSQEPHRIKQLVVCLKPDCHVQHQINQS